MIQEKSLTLLSKKEKIVEMEIRKRKILGYLRWKNRGTYRPTEIKMAWIARRFGITYKQARVAVDKLVEDGKIEKFSYWIKNEDKPYLGKPLLGACSYRVRDKG